MFAIFLYVMILALLIYWVESEARFIPKVLIIKKSDPAEELENWLKKFNWLNRHEPSCQGHFPKYKFYSEIVELLLNLSRKMGGSYQDSIIFLREGLQADKQFEKKLKEIVLGTWLQMGLLVVLTWAFILGALALVDVKISFSRLFLIGLWQLIGLSFLPFLLKYFREKFFGDIGKLWKMLYVLRSLAKIPLSRTEVFTDRKSVV